MSRPFNLLKYPLGLVSAFKSVVQYETDFDNPCDSYQTKTESTAGLDRTAFLKLFTFVPPLHT